MTPLFRYFRELWAAALEGWDHFWFTSADPATLGLIRICAGAMLFWTHLVWSVDLTGWLGPHGRLTPAFNALHHNSFFGWSYLNWITDPTLLWIAHVIALIVLAMFTLGLFTRVTSLLTLLITISYAHRAAGTLFGLDQINGLLALYLAVGPCGAAFSLDAWLWPKWASDGLGAGQGSVLANLAIRLIQVHMCVVYFFAGTGKLAGVTWWDGTAIWGSLASYEYQTLDCTWLAAWPWAINFLTHLTVFWEVTYPFLVWPRWTRPIWVALSIPLHLGIAIALGMVEFGLIMIVGNMAFLSPELVREMVGSTDPSKP